MLSSLTADQMILAAVVVGGLFYAYRQGWLKLSPPPASKLALPTYSFPPAPPLPPLPPAAAPAPGQGVEAVSDDALFADLERRKQEVAQQKAAILAREAKLGRAP